MANKEDIKEMRTCAIFNFCDELHNDINNLYELMVDGSDEEEKKAIEVLIEKLKGLNTDR